MSVLRRLSLACGLLLAAGVGVFFALDAAFPPDLSKARDLSRAVTGLDGRFLHLTAADDGALRLPAAPGEVEPVYLAMLIAYEDRRFRSHPGVDPLAVARALAQMAANGRVVSGASTLTMQVARLLEPRPRTLGAKLIEAFRALQLERRLSKDDILGLYLTLAPFGGRLEGVRTASLSYYGKEPDRLTGAEAALLVALPQAPSAVRPDRHPGRALAARDKVLARAVTAGALSPDAAASARAERLSARLSPLPRLAPHAAARLLAGTPPGAVVRSTLDAGLQAALEGLARRSASALDERASVAILLVENRTRQVRAYVGSPGLDQPDREGFVDMVAARRSPGSALKPLVYAMAFDRGLAHPETLVDDVPTRFGDYAPTNFGEGYAGRVSLREALQLSLNVPAVALLDRLGPVPAAEAMRRAGIALDFGSGDAAPGLAFALGGVGISLEDMARLYAALADDGRPKPLVLAEGMPPQDETFRFVREAARWQVGRILLGVPAPAGALAESARSEARAIAFKTGTSYGFRDALAVGYDALHTLAVWTGRPDGTPSPGRYGAETAAPILLRAFAQLPQAGPAASPVPPPGVLVAANRMLPPGLRRLGGLSAIAPPALEPAPSIAFPPEGATIALADIGPGLALAADGGRRPLRWLVDGRPLGPARRDRGATWHPAGPGFAEISVVDALGRPARVTVFVSESRSGVGDEPAADQRRAP